MTGLISTDRPAPCEVCPHCGNICLLFRTRVPHSIQHGEIVYEAAMLCRRCATSLMDAVRAWKAASPDKED